MLFTTFVPSGLGVVAAFYHFDLSIAASLVDSPNPSHVEVNSFFSKASVVDH